MRGARVAKAALAYFGAVFAAGFILGAIRVSWLLPRLGQRVAELLEAPFMLVVIVLAARWTVRRFASPSTARERLMVGVAALALMLAVEFTVVLWLRGMTLADDFAGRDPVAGAVYYALLVAFALLPLLSGAQPRTPAGIARP